ncbi:uncharacterized protein MAM_06479 [Metarhizium album ARSEF 1941]|uniref:Uncharacterized protein n=1 Tax=Metarhizium album (strain ARSEF 1941) TaxID=1081103 RepID=A0A0B2WNR8_METAS|nr:uncharacterized protein MAM_06479 [Metarhizium album ARSEF 1941]KHN95638.1 hypothetical protein MAM_06479 [Metarhizium album ARSEF 1941]
MADEVPGYKEIPGHGEGDELPAQRPRRQDGEVWEENPNDWYAQPLKWWNHRHAFEPGYCIETRFGGDSDSGRWFKANHRRAALAAIRIIGLA